MTEITSQMVAALREKTGAGYMDCKKALQESNGVETEAIVFLREKGIASAAKKAGRSAKEGLVHAYIHGGGKLGVLVEVNCETDFVARNEEFRQMVADIAMQIAAANPLYLTQESVPQEVIEKETKIAQAQCAGKPAAAIAKIVEGKLKKWFGEVCLLDQPFVKDPSMTIRDLITSKIAKLGENIVIRRFVRFPLGE
ncbi:MAG: translation elongation factor Ts [Opitutales bacterium]|nr:translation elongation factor Ts [Opitutales bacterium]